MVGVRHLLRLQLRRDRLWWPIWAFCLILMPLVTVGSYETLYPTAADRAGATADVASNPSLLAVYGPAYDLSTSGGFISWRVLGYTCTLAGLVGLLTIIRHTRVEEETGRLELLRSGVLGRHASLVAGLLGTFAWSLLIGVVTFVGLIAQDLSTTGSLLTGAATTLTLMVFAGVGAVAAQITEHGRTARGIAGAVLGGAFLLRALGDSSDGVSFLSWLSPIGWAQQARPYAGDRTWVVLIPVLIIVALTATAVALENRRDLTASLIPSRLGPARGSMSTMAALAARLQRGSLVAWSVGLAIGGFAIGGIADGILDLLKDNKDGQEILQRMGGSGALIDTYFAAIIPLMAVIAAVHGIGAIGRVASEETEQRGELVLATATSRSQFFGQHLLWALGGAIVLMLVTGATTALGYLATGADADQIMPLIGATVAQVPAIWVVIGVAALGVGVSARLSLLGWVAVGVCMFIAWIGPILQLPDAVMDVSPFRHVPTLPGADMEWLPLIILTVIAGVLTAVGWVAYHRRDVAA
ncbi:hypothetical protein VV02_02080 [Luteipulveratus mongoliensis]|uniref:ABC transporter permease n=1 Tax=Luteipulveratus mongoliensis TaxID=571913 RepID=A0A0K1JPB2_9MICO|nr:hypothetical protein VV02_02080 [Luteipulveratus mongoliensis]